MKLCDPSESILVTTHPAWINNLPWIILIAMIPIVLMFFGISLVIGLIAFIGLALILGLNAIYEHYKADYLITNKRIIVRLGLLSTKQFEVWLSDARGLSLEESLWQKVIGTGDIMVGTAATAGTEIVIRGIKRPQAVVDIINKYRRGQNSVSPAVHQPESSQASIGQVVYDPITHQYMRK